MKQQLSLLLSMAACVIAGQLHGQVFSISQSQVEIAIAPSYNHAPVEVAVIGNAPDLDFNELTVTSDASWVTPAVDAAGPEIRLSFTTANLTNSAYTATITASLGGESDTFFVKAYVSPMNIFKLKDDPLRSRAYGIQTNGLSLGSVVVFDPITMNRIGNVTVGKKPTDLAISDDGLELFVINAVDESISVIDLESLAIKETLALPEFNNWRQEDTTANIAVGPGDTLYYIDCGGAPLLRVLNRSTMEVLQTVYSSGDYGFGDIGLTPDKTILFGWGQFGWSAGWAGSYIVKYEVAANGTLTFLEKTDSNWPTTLRRDPLETPVQISSDGATVFIKQIAVNSAAPATVLNAFPTPVYSITPGGEIAATATAVYEAETGVKLADLPTEASVQAISSDYSRLIYFDSAARALKALNLLELIGPGILNQNTMPADGSITLAPERREWAPLPGVNRYDVYLGQSEAAVAAADTASPLFLGSVTEPYLQLLNLLTPGTTYHWRVDAVTAFDTTSGDVKQFTVSLISSDSNEIEAATVRGHREFKTALELSSSSPGLEWQANGDQSWVSFANNSGSTPATLEVLLNASELAAGVHEANITISSGGDGLFSIPVKFRVSPLNLTIMKSDAETPFVYAISEDTSTGFSRAYLLEINSVTESIRRVVEVGSSATDLAIHKADNRIYVPNWRPGALLAIDLDSFEQVRSYAFAPFGGTGYSQGDVYRVSPGGPGRLVWEEEDQWIDISIFDTDSGTNLATAGVREGGGETSPDRRYYYHGENNSSGAELLKFDMIGDTFTQMASVRVGGTGYGSRTVVVSEEGNRIFWGGGVFDADLEVEWTLSDRIYAASADGRYAFAESNVYDTAQRSVLTSLVPATPVKAFNSVTGKLAYKGSDSIHFFKLHSRDSVTPDDGSIVTTLGELEWESVPVATSYRVYLGESQEAVALAGPHSPLFLGEVALTSFALDALAAGAYFWRVDAVTPYGTVSGGVQTFTLAPVTPDTRRISAVTFLDRPETATVTLTSPSEGQVWQASADVDWISLSQTSGVTPAALEITLTPSEVAPLVRTGSITISAADNPLFTIPVELTVESLHLTVIKSDPTSVKAYAVSEDTASLSARAYLLEIDTSTETIERVISVGSSVTDLAIHNGDNRLYVPNWSTGKLLAVDKTSFEQVRSYTFSPPGSYNDGDVYRVAAGAPGRLVFEEEDQWIDVTLFDTNAGTNLASTFEREGGGAFGGDGRYYYHGDNNSSGAEIHKFDVLGDQFSELAHVRVSSVSYYGSRTVVVSDDGSRVFWNGSVFDADLTEHWSIGDEIYSTSADGRYAFSRRTIYDTVEKAAVLGMPLETAVSAFHSTTEKLLVQVGGSIGF
ncbi:MAG: BACON domain-containing carbohydrate-binding protein, partial [Opitutales bacterium]